MNHLIESDHPLCLYAWASEEERLGFDVITSNPFGNAQKNSFLASQHYFAEYHLEYSRQRHFQALPSRLHALLLFATKTDAKRFGTRHPDLVADRQLIAAHSLGDYKVSFHDSTFLDYLRLPHSLDLSGLDQIAHFYWSGFLAKEINLIFFDEPWEEEPIVEAIFQGKLSVAAGAISEPSFAQLGR